MLSQIDVIVGRGPLPLEVGVRISLRVKEH